MLIRFVFSIVVLAVVDVVIVVVESTTDACHNKDIGRWFDQYIILLMENQDLPAILSNSDFFDIAKQGILQKNYHAVTHPSQPNYWSTIAGGWNFPGQLTYAYDGSNVTLTGDNGDADITIDADVKTIIDLLDNAGWNHTVYSEGYPTPGSCFFGTGYGNLTDEQIAHYNPGTIGASPIDRSYKRKHNPFLSFQRYVNHTIHCSRQQGFDRLAFDLAHDNLAAFSYVVPNQANDGHDTTIAFTGTWMKQFLHNITNSVAYQNHRTLIHIVYDEDDTAYTYYHNAPVDNANRTNPYYNASCVLAGPSYSNCAPLGCRSLYDCPLNKNHNLVYSVLLGNAIPPRQKGTIDKNYYTHASIVTTLEMNWNLGTLESADVTANPFQIHPYYKAYYHAKFGVAK